MCGLISTVPYEIRQVDNCYLVILRGKWNMSTNIQYLAQLSETLKSRKGRAFHLFVDMRTWQIPNSDIYNQIKAPMKLDRRNQLGELWLEDECNDYGNIAEKFLSEQKFVLERTNTVDAFLKSVAERAGKVAANDIKSWVENEEFDKQIYSPQ